MPAPARIGDRVTHNYVKFGAIVTGASRTVFEGAAVARVGDMATCPTHGPQPIANGSASVQVEGQAVARVGDTLACGAVIVDGAASIDVG
jgi:uncharacterized Zn-binding protein involved in type VI secretion